jgi:5-methylcytosine-specific restriction endonuclease McrA
VEKYDNMAKENNSVHEVVLRYLREFDIPIRTSSQAAKLNASKGQNHWNWRGGDKGTYSDNYKCQLCGRKEEENLKLFQACLSVHHIDYNKKNDDKNNLITLCLPCHSSTHKNRKQWIEHFKKQIKEKLK